jgi:hypothetical protein
VNSTGTIAVVAERDRAKAAIIDLTANTVTAEVPVGGGPVAVAIAGNVALVVNQQDDTVSVFSLSNLLQVTNVPVQHGPRGIAIDATGARAFVTDQQTGNISVIDIAGRSVVDTIVLGAAVRPQAIQIASNFAIVSDPNSGPDGRLLIVDLTTKQVVSVSANPDRSGGVSDIVVFNNIAFVASQTGGSILFAPITVPNFAPTSIKAGTGARALAVDALDKLLIVANQGSGNLTLIDLTTNRVVGQIDAVRSNEDEDDDHEDRGRSANLPTVSSLAPSSGKQGTTFALTITGTNLTGASDVIFLDPASIPGKGHDKGKGNDDGDSGITVKNIAVNTAGTQLTVQVQIAAGHPAGTRVVRVLTPNGESSFVTSAGNTFTVTQ